MKLFRSIIRFFKRFRARPIPSTTTNPREVIKEPSLDFVPAFFCVIGHNKYAQGTSFDFGEELSEYEFNKPIGFKTGDILDGLCPAIPFFVLLRPVGSYNHQKRSIKNAIIKITNKMRSYGVNLHFNSGGGIGSESLISKLTQDDFDNLFSDLITDSIEGVFKIPQRRNDGVYVVGENHNGAGMLKSMREANCTSSILEPVFDHDHDHARAIAENPDKYARVIAETIVILYYWKGWIKKTDIKEVLQFWDITSERPKVRVRSEI